MGNRVGREYLSLNEAPLCVQDVVDQGRGVFSQRGLLRAEKVQLGDNTGESLEQGDQILKHLNLTHRRVGMRKG